MFLFVCPPVLNDTTRFQNEVKYLMKRHDNLNEERVRPSLWYQYKEESIPVGCIPSACEPYVFWYPPIGVSSRRGCLSQGRARYRPQTKFGQGNIFAPVCHSVHRGGICLIAYWDTHREPPTPGSRHLPWSRYTPIPFQPQCMLGDTGNKRAVCILLECNLVFLNFCIILVSARFSRVCCSSLIQCPGDFTTVADGNNNKVGGFDASSCGIYEESWIRH